MREWADQTMDEALHAADPPSYTTDADRVSALLASFPSPATALRPDGGDAVTNPAYIKLFGLTEPGSGKRLCKVIHPDDIPACWDFIRRCFTGEAQPPIELRATHADGSYLRCVWMARLDPETGWFIASAMDITERHDRQHELIEETRTDPLTEVANRAGLLHALAVATAADEYCALALVDLDRFKAVNDTFGHAVGDEVLKTIAARLQQATPPGSLVSRTGGDEFVILFRDDQLSSLEIGPMLTRVVTEPIQLAERRIMISGSVGITGGTRSTDPTTMLQHADFAVYEAKQHHGATWRLADDELVSRRRREMLMEQRLRAAAETNEFVPWFQPIVSTSDGATVAYESLMRWAKPDGTVVAAGDFIKLATDVGLTSQISGDVVAQTLQIAGALQDVPFAINLSPAELADTRWLDRVIHMVDVANVRHDRIVFEVTEDSVIRDLMIARTQLQQLNDLGFRVALDDFGSGYSSLTHLTTLPIDIVKLDRGLLATRHQSTAGKQAFEATVRFVQELGYEMIVEGVETQQDHDTICELGVKLAQGWHYGPAVAPAMIPDLS